ncbi:unnamed protein product, partial [Linum tenue]
GLNVLVEVCPTIVQEGRGEALIPLVTPRTFSRQDTVRFGPLHPHGFRLGVQFRMTSHKVTHPCCAPH